MGQTSTLLNARVRALGNARAAGAGAFRPQLALGALVLVGALVAAGELAATSMLDVPAETATPVLGKRGPIAGDAALEAAFWLACLLSAFFSFRVMESLFRSPHIRALELLPVEPGPILGERIVNAMLEGTAMGLCASAFFVPLAWHASPTIAALCGGIVTISALCTAAVTIGINTWFGAQWGGASGLGDGYGGQGGAFIYAPMVALTTSVGCTFMLQLGARELLHDGRVTNAAMLGAGIAVGVAAAALTTGARSFVASYHRVAAFFREADDVGYQAVMDYQQSSWNRVRFEHLAGPTGALVYRRHATQFSRRFAVGRSLAAIGAVCGALGAAMFSSGAYPNWLAALVPALVLALLARPFSRIEDTSLGGENDPLLPISPGVVERATIAWWLVETGRLALPFAAVTAAIRGYGDGAIEGLLLGVLALGVAFAATGVAGVALRRSMSVAARQLGGLFVILLLGVAGAYDLRVGAAVGAALAVLTVAGVFRRGKS